MHVQLEAVLQPSHTYSKIPSADPSGLITLFSANLGSARSNTAAESATVLSRALNIYAISKSNALYMSEKKLGLNNVSSHYL